MILGSVQGQVGQGFGAIWKLFLPIRTTLHTKCRLVLGFEKQFVLASAREKTLQKRTNHSVVDNEEMKICVRSLLSVTAAFQHLGSRTQNCRTMKAGKDLDTIKSYCQHSTIPRLTINHVLKCHTFLNTSRGSTSALGSLFNEEIFPAV
ncbi:hypothetical protein DUI87_22171 [Hirundo rustica rustica]|uniref:Uncharacterized protein n=1 Tax=Hirundo rustica rustica TaxID=333673 RepID=A0A3M0JJC2_HIRRU|nr:hypothetical protein DUI87_22171 [Hirundo rustica rustica]